MSAGVAAAVVVLTPSAGLAELAASAGSGVVGAVGAAPARAFAADGIRGQEWWLASMHVTQVWPLTRGSGVTVAVLSTGVDAAHPDLTGSVITGPDETGSGRTAGGPDWGIEGTSAASVIAGHGDDAGNASGIAGIAPAATILSVRVVLDATDPLNASPAVAGHLPDAIAAGIRYAVSHGARVIDLPLDPASLASDGAASGGLRAAAGGSAAERTAVSYALSQGVVLVAPAGDDGASGAGASGGAGGAGGGAGAAGAAGAAGGGAVDYPAAYPGVIALGAVDRGLARPEFGSRQSYVALTAPGVGVTAAGPPAGYRTMTTTDAASAIAAGVAALIRSRYPGLSAGQVRQALLNGTVPGAAPPGTPGYGVGTLDALKAVQAATSIAAVPGPAAGAGPGAGGHAGPAGPAGGTQAGRGATATGSVGTARAVFRDATMAAGLLIVVLGASLAGVRFRRRRARPAPRAAAVPRAQMRAPPGRTAARPARRSRLAAPAAPSATGTPGAPGAPVAPEVAPGTALAPAATPARAATRAPAAAAARLAVRGGARARALPVGEGPGPLVGTRPGPGAHGRRPRIAPAPRASAQAQLAAAGRPPWDPAPMPSEPLPPDPVPSADWDRDSRYGFPARPAPSGLSVLSGRSGTNSGPLYVWDPDALTDPFPAVSPLTGRADPPGTESMEGAAGTEGTEGTEGAGGPDRPDRPGR